MRRLRVALLTRAGSTPGQRLPGMFAYAVPEFTVTHYQVGKGFCLSKDEIAERHDVIVYEDGKTWGRLTGRARIPVCYLVSDSTLSEQHYQRRLEQARQADLILVDWDRLERFQGVGVPVRRLSYCVNDLIFRDWGQPKIVDVACHLHTKGSPEREALVHWLAEFCEQRGYSYAAGIRFGTEYALALNRARVMVDLARNNATRNHRTFDAMASMTCLVTSPLPIVSGEDHGLPGVHYLPWVDYPDLALRLEYALRGGDWWQIADAAHDLAHSRHTWRVRAAELRAILAEAFPHLGEAAA